MSDNKKAARDELAAGGEGLEVSSSALNTTTNDVIRQAPVFSPESCYHLAHLAKDEKQRERWLERAKEAELNAGARVDQFLSHLHRGGAYAYLWRPYISRWYETSRKRKTAQAGKDTYFGVHPSRFIPEKNARGEKRPAHKVRSQKNSISAVNCLFAEIDAKDFITHEAGEIEGRAAPIRAEHPDWAEDKVTREAEKTLTGGKLKHRLTQYKALAWQHVQSMRPAPSVIVDSGGGYHCYWLIDEPFYTVKHEARERAGKLQADWVGLMGGDPDAKDLARVLRLPGTTNNKDVYASPQTVRFKVWKPGQTYTFDELEKRAESATENPDFSARTEKRPVAENATIVAPHYTTPATSDKEQKQRALDALAPGRADDYTTWYKVGMACHYDQDMDFADWDQWSQQSPKYHEAGNAELMRSKWETFKTTRDRILTFDTVFKWAHQDCPGWHLVHNEATPAVRAALAVEAPAPKIDLPTRVGYCGMRFEYSDPNAFDKKKIKVWVCADYRNCDFCAQTKARDLQERIRAAMERGPVYATRVSINAGRQLVRRHGKDNTLRVPLDGDVVVIFNPDTGTEILPGTLPAIEDVVTLVKAIPVNKRITGHLGKEDEAGTIEAKETNERAPTDDSVAVMIKMIAHDADKETADKIYKAAWERTKARILAMPLENAIDVENAHDRVMTEYKRLLRMAGFAIEHQFTREVTCHLTRISVWKDRYVLNHMGAGGTSSNDPTPTGPRAQT